MGTEPTTEESHVLKGRHLVLIFSVAALLPLVGPWWTAASAVEKREVHCTVEVTGQDASGQFTTTEPRCSRSRPDEVQSLSSSTLAVHYSGGNFTGSTFTVTGSGCSGGWLNFPSEWTNVISSTWSGCAVSHFDYFYLTGDVEVTYGSSNLGSLNNRTNSARYS